MQIRNELTAALQAYQAGNLPGGAERRVDQLLLSDPRSAAATRVKGMIVMAKGDHLNALKWLTTSLQIETEPP